MNQPIGRIHGKYTTVRFILQFGNEVPRDVSIAEYAAAAGCSVFDVPSAFGSGRYLGWQESFTMTRNSAFITTLVPFGGESDGLERVIYHTEDSELQGWLDGLTK